MASKLKRIVSALSLSKDLTGSGENYMAFAQTIYELNPDLKVRVELENLRSELYRNRGEYAGKFTPEQLELFCKLKRELAKIEEEKDI